MPLDEQSRRKQNLVIGNQQYDSNRFFYGISKGPSAFSASMKKLFRLPLLRKSFTTSLDGVFNQLQIQTQFLAVFEKKNNFYKQKTLKHLLTIFFPKTN